MSIGDVIIPEGHRPPIDITGNAYVTTQGANYQVMGRIMIGTDGIVKGYFASAYNNVAGVENSFNPIMRIFASIPWIV